MVINFNSIQNALDKQDKKKKKQQDTAPKPSSTVSSSKTKQTAANRIHDDDVKLSYSIADEMKKREKRKVTTNTSSVSKNAVPKKKIDYLEQARNANNPGTVKNSYASLTDKERTAKIGRIDTKINELRNSLDNASMKRLVAARGNAPKLREEATLEFNSLNSQIRALEKERDHVKYASVSYYDDLERSEREADWARQDAIRQLMGQNPYAIRSMVVNRPEEYQARREAVRTANSNYELLHSEKELVDYINKYDEKSYDDDFTGQFGANRTQGRLSQDVSMAWNEYIKNPTPENKAYANAIEQVIGGFTERNAATLADDATLPWISQSAANYLPQFFDQAMAGGKGAVVGALGGVAAGTVVPGLGNVAGAVTGAKAGAVAGVGKYSFDTMRGAAFRELIAEGFDEKAAIEAANDEALISALIEMADTGIDIATLGFGSILKQTGKFAAKQVAKTAAKEAGETALKKAGKVLGGYGRNILSEGAEEGSQQAVSIANRKRLESGKDTGLTSLLSQTWQVAKDVAQGKDAESAAEIWDNAKEGMKIATMFGGGTLATNTAIVEGLNTKLAASMGEKYTDVAGDLVQEGLAADSNTSAFKMATKLQAKLDKGQTLRNAELGKQVYANELAFRSESTEVGANAPNEASKAVSAQDGTIESNTTQNTLQMENRSVAAKSMDSAKVVVPTAKPLNVLSNEARKTVTGLDSQVKKLTGYGENGVRLFSSILKNNESMNPAALKKSFQTSYEAGLLNVPIEKVSFANDLQEQAYFAGRKDYVLSMKKDELKAGYATIYGDDAGFIVTDAAKGVNSNLTDALGQISKALGIKTRFEESVYGGRANGSYQEGILTIAKNADNPYAVVAAHEIMHRMQELAPNEYATFREYAVRSESGLFGVDAYSLVEQYQNAAADAGVTLSTTQAMDEIAADFAGKVLGNERDLQSFIEDANSSRENQKAANKFFAAVRDFINKVKAVFKGNRKQMEDAAQETFGASIAQLEHAEKLWREAYKASVAAVQKKQGRDHATATDGTTLVANARYSLNQSFAQQFDEWMTLKESERFNSKGSFLIGTTSEALQSIDVKDYKIYWNKSKMVKIMDKHKEMTPNVIKSVPSIIENPVMVLQSQTVANSIVVFGEVYSAKGDPIMVAINLSPGKKQGVIADFAVISSAYKRPLGQIQNLMDTSDILYLDPNKKRTDAWIQSLGLHLPPPVTKYGSIGMVTYYDGKSNSVQEGKTAFELAFEAAEKQQQQAAEVRYSLNPKFAATYDKWAANGRRNRERLFVGRTSDALQGVGVREQGIYWDTAKINVTLAKHENLSDSILKQVPNILENPVIILESVSEDTKAKKPTSNRIVLLGEVYDKSSLPVLAILELEPRNKKDLLLQEIKVVSTYSKDAHKAATQDLINKSPILYIDPNKKRTNTWLVSNRLQLPLDMTKYGSIDKVSYSDDLVNSKGMQNDGNYAKTLVELAFEAAEGKDQGSTKIRYSLNQSFAEQVDEVLNSASNFEKTHLYMGQTPEFFAKFGLDTDKPLLVTSKHIRNMASKPQTSTAKNVNVHGLTKKQIKSLPEKIKEPVAVMVSRTRPEDSIVVVTDMLDKEKRPVIAAIFLDGNGRYNKVKIEANILTSAYGRQGFEDFLINAYVGDRMLYIDKEKSHQLRQNPGVQFPNNLPSGDFENNIQRFKENVKRGKAALYERFAKAEKNKAESHGGGKHFSLKRPLEETKDLIAVHNLREGRLKGVVDLGGFPMPSIAVTKTDMLHENFGDISVLFNKETINPTDRRNKVYSADAWTPSFPSVGYKLNDKTASAIQKKIDILLQGTDYKEVFRFFIDNWDIQNRLESSDGDFREAYQDSYGMKLSYLLDTGVDFKPAMQEKSYSTNADNIVLRKIDRALKGKIGEILDAGYDMAMKQEPLIRKLLNDYVEQKGGMRIYKDKLSYGKVDEMLTAAKEYGQNGAVKVTDYYKTRDRLDRIFGKKSIASDFNAWLADLGKDVVEKRGIRNHADRFTPSGNRRSFEALYWDYTLDHVIKAMSADAKKGIGGAFGGFGALAGASSKEFKTITEIKKDSSRLQNLNDEEMDVIRDNFENKIFEITDRMIRPNDHSFGVRMDATEAITEAVAKGKTKAGILRYLKEWVRFNVNEDIASDIYDLSKEIAKMPTRYFEAKPQRAVGFDEVAAIVLPKTTDAKLKVQLKDEGIKVVEYNSKKEGDRLAKVNSVKDIRFSLKKNSNRRSEGGNGKIKLNKQEFTLLSSARKMQYYVYKKQMHKIDGIFANNMFYVIHNFDEDGFDALQRLDPDVSYEKIKTLMEAIESGRYDEKTFDGSGRAVDALQDGKGFDDRHRYDAGGRGTDGRTDTVDTGTREPAGASFRISESGGDRGDIYRGRNGGKYSLKGQTNLLKENAILRETVDYLKGQLETTKFAAVDKKSLDKMSSRLLKDYSSFADKDMIRGKLDDLYKYMANGEDGNPAAWNDVYSRAYEIAEDIIDSVSITNDDLYTQYKELRTYLRTAGIRVGEEYRDSDFNEIRKSNFGKVLITNDGTPVDKMYSALSSEYPELFPDDEVNPGGMNKFEYIVKIANDLQPFEENPYDVNVSEASSWLANDMIERFFELPQAKSTFADKVEQKRIKQKMIAADRVERIRRQKDARIEEIKEQHRTTKAGERERRNKSEFKKKIRKHVDVISKMLLKPSETSHVPEVLRSSVADFLEVLDFTTPKQKEKTVNRLNALRNEYQKIADGKTDFDMELDPDILDNLLDVIEEARTGGNIQVADLSVRGMNSLYRVVMAVERSIYNYNKILREGQDGVVSKLGEKAIREMATKKGYQESALKGKQLSADLLNMDMVTPQSYFKQLGGTMDGLWADLRKGFDAKIEHIAFSKEYVEDLLGDNKPKEWSGKKAVASEFTVSNGQKISLPPSQVMSLYLLQKQKGALNHIYKGGIKQAPTVSLKDKGRLPELIKSIDPVKVTPDDVAAIIGTLTPAQKAVADGIGKFFTDYTAAWGNEVSLLLYGYKKFTVENYFPIVSDDNYITQVFGETTDATLKNMGSTKSRIKGANNPIFIEDVFDVFTRQADQMSSYNAFVIPLSNIQRVFNYKTFDGSVKQSIEKKYGTRAIRYFKNLMTDINGGSNWRGGSAAMSNRISKYKQARLGMSSRVILQQPSAYLRAMTVLDSRYMAQALASVSKVDTSTIYQYAPIALWKDWGYFSMDTGKRMKSLIMNEKELSDFTMWGAGKMDKLTWKRLWLASEFQIRATRPELAIGSEDYYEAVGELFSTVIDETQVVDSTLHRSQIMRNPDTAVKMAVSFLSEPMKAYNMLRTAGQQARQNPSKATKIAFATAAYAYMASIVVNHLITAFVDTIRSDEEDEPWLEELINKAMEGITGEEVEKTAHSWQHRYIWNFINNLVNEPLSMFPYVKDITSMVQGFTVERMDMQGIGDVVSAGNRAFSDKYTIGFKVADLTSKAADIFGIPVSNVKREISTLVKIYLDTADNTWLEYENEKLWHSVKSSSNRSKFMDILYKALKSGDEELYRTIVKDLIDQGYDATYITSSMTSRTKKDPDIATNFANHRELYLSAGIKYNVEENKKQTPKFTVDDLTGLENDQYLDLYGSLVNGMIDDFNKHGLSKMDAERGNNLRNAAYKYSADISLEKSSNGKYKIETQWIQKARDAAKIGLTAPEYIRLMEEYDPDAIGSDNVYKAYESGVDVKTYLDFKEKTNDMKADYKTDSKGNPLVKPDGSYVTIPYSKKNKIIAYLNTLGLTQEEYGVLMEISGYSNPFK